MNREILPIGSIKSAKDVGEIVSRYRKMQELTQVELAGLAQTGTRFISDLENGKGTVQFDKVMHILDLLGVEVVAKER
ncbi:MAG: helix-turn-helix transcriptional regulator [Methylococcaceae bacterium]|nr:helix-turn-helix transcriptional regulator [Methylococcaceae bacterium]